MSLKRMLPSPPCIDMLATCERAHNMSRMVQIRNVPDVLHRKLKVRAAASGQTLSDYLLREMERLAARPTREEMLASNSQPQTRDPEDPGCGSHPRRARLRLDLHRHAHVDLAARAWKLRNNISAYDAMYVALAEAIDATIVTCDGPLAKAPGHRATIELID
jgi:antitoxin FitA